MHTVLHYHMRMRTTLDLPDVLIQEAMLLTKIPTKTELIKFALENVIQGEKVKELSGYFGKFSLDINIDELRNRGTTDQGSADS